LEVQLSLLWAHGATCFDQTVTLLNGQVVLMEAAFSLQ